MTKPDGKDETLDDSVTAWLQKGAHGDVEAENRALERLLPDLRRHARARIRGEVPGPDLETDLLIETAYRSVRLSATKPPAFASRKDFVAVLKHRMNQKLIDRGRGLTRNAARARKGAAIEPQNIPSDSQQPKVSPGRQVEFPIDDARGIAVQNHPSEQRDAENARQALANLAKVDGEAHRLLMLHYRDGLPWEEVALAINKPLGTTKRLATQAKRRLAELSGIV